MALLKKLYLYNWIHLKYISKFFLIEDYINLLECDYSSKWHALNSRKLILFCIYFYRFKSKPNKDNLNLIQLYCSVLLAWELCGVHWNLSTFSFMEISCSPIHLLSRNNWDIRDINVKMVNFIVFLRFWDVFSSTVSPNNMFEQLKYECSRVVIHVWSASPKVAVLNETRR